MAPTGGYLGGLLGAVAHGVGSIAHATAGGKPPAPQQARSGNILSGFAHGVQQGVQNVGRGATLPGNKQTVKAIDVAVHQPAAQRYLQQNLGKGTIVGQGNPQDNTKALQGALKLLDNHQVISTRSSGLNTLAKLGALPTKIAPSANPAPFGQSYAAGAISSHHGALNVTGNVAFPATGEGGAGIGKVLGSVGHTLGHAAVGAANYLSHNYAGAPGGQQTGDANPVVHAANQGVHAFNQAMDSTVGKAGHEATMGIVKAGGAGLYGLGKLADRAASIPSGNPLQQGFGIGNLSAIPPRAVEGVGKAFMQHPEDTAKHTAQGLKDAAIGTLSGIVSLPVNEVIATIHGHPEQPISQLANQIVHDYARRYGVLLKPGGVAQFAERVRQEGAAAEGLDALGLKAVWDKTVGPAILGANRAVAKGDLLTRDRPGLQAAQGIVKPQTLAPTTFGILRQRGLDALRANADKQPVVGAELSRSGDALHARPTRAMPPPLPLDTVRPLINPTGREAKIAAATLGIGHKAFGNARLHEALPVAKALRKLSPDEQKAFGYVAQGELPANAATHGNWIQQGLINKLNNIAATRAEKGTRGIVSDEAPVLHYLLAHMDTAFTPRLQQVVQDLHPRDVAVAAKSPRLTDDQAAIRRIMPMAHELGVRRGEIPGYTTRSTADLSTVQDKLAKLRALARDRAATPAESALADQRANELVARAATQVEHVPTMRYVQEALPDYLNRVEQARVAAGREHPVYLPGEAFGGADYSAHALAGQHAPRPTFEYTGELKNLGARNLSPQTYLSGLTRTLKAPYQLATVAKLVDDHAVIRNTTMRDGLTFLHQHGLNPHDYYFWDRGQLARNIEATHYAPGNERFLADVQRDPTMTAGFTPADAANPHGIDTGYSLIPKAVGEQIMGSARGGSKFGRAIDVSKSFSSRAILGSNPSWVAYQGLSQYTMAGLLTGGRSLNPLSWRGLREFWNGLPPEQRQALNAELDPRNHAYSPEVEMRNAALGLGPHISDLDLKQAQMGSQARAQYRGFLGDLHGALSKTGFFTAATKGNNALSALIRADLTFKDLTRMRVAKDLLAHPRLPAMEQAIHDMGQTQNRMQNLLHGTPDDVVNALKNDPTVVHEMGQHLNDFLGNYTTFTNVERAALNRFTMFYAFVRYSLKLLFYTMPVKHPLAASVIGNLGRLKSDEVKQLAGDTLGGSSVLPAGAGLLRFGKNGELSVDLTRANPVVDEFTNWDLTSANPLSSVANLSTPIGQWLYSVVADRNTFTGQPLSLGGYSGNSAKRPGLSLGEAGLVGTADLLRLFAPYRTAEKILSPNSTSQADSNLLFHNAPALPTSPSRAAALQAKADEHKAAGPDWLQIVKSIVPFIPTNDSLQAKAARNRQYLSKSSSGGSSGGSGFYSNSGSGGSGFYK